MIRRLVRSAGTAAICTTLAALFLFPNASAAQEGTTSGSVGGTVLGPDGQPVADAVVRVVSQARGGERQVLTNASGRFRVPLLQPGLYTVRAELPPNQPVEVSDVRVSLGERTSVTLELQPVEGEALEITVGGADEVDLTQGGVSENVSETQINNLPTAGRDFTDFINLSGLVSPQPGIGTGGQFSIGGARTTATNVQIDGADANNSFFGENRGSSRVPFTFSLESIKEFQIITNGFDVEYGRYSGGVVNAVTKSGTNEFRGTAHLFWRDEALTSDGFDGNPPTDFKSFQFGGSVSGPIVEDKLHYFFSGDFQQRDEPVFALDPTRANLDPQTIERLAGALEEIGIENAGSDFGTFEETKDQANIFGRLDWTINPDHRLTFRANYSDFENQNDRISTSGRSARTLGSTFNDESLSLVAEFNSILGEDVYNTFRVQYSDEDRPRPGNSSLPLMDFESVENADGRPVTLSYGGDVVTFGDVNRLEERKIQITNNLTWNLGDDHTLKVGTDNIFSHLENRFWALGNGIYSFGDFFDDGIEALRNEAPYFFIRLFPQGNPDEAPESVFDNQDLSVYAQDTWQASDKLRVTLGLRYDWKNFLDQGQPLADDGDRQILNEEFGLNMSTVPEDRDNLSPRFSFTYDVEGDETNVIRGGAGIFYGRFPNVLHGNVLQSTPNPLLFLLCGFNQVPEFDLSEIDGPADVPASCGSNDNFPFGFGFTGEPQLSVWSEDMQQPTTFKANLGYDTRLSEDWRAGLQVIFSRTVNNYSVQDLNLRETQFTNAEGRPVHVPQDDYDPTSGASRFGRGVVTELDRVLTQTDEGKFRAWNVKAEVSGQVTDDFRLAANYTWNHAFDNTSYICCSSFAFLEDTPTFGNPNELGDFGESERGNWGPTDFERRHVFVANGIWTLPADLQVSFIYRAQSGNPFTPSVSGDLNGDGLEVNDRPYLPDPASGFENAAFGEFDSGSFVNAAENRQAYEQLLQENECLRENVGGIIPRNECRNPWWHSLDLKVKKGFDTFGGQRFDVILDMFNVLDGVNNLFDLDWSAGEFVVKSDQLFRAEGTTDDGRVVYSVSDFGREFPIGSSPFQFQAQLGVKYHF